MIEAQQHNHPTGGSGRLKYADPKSLPSYPSVGLRRADSAAAAATLGWASQKPAAEKKRPQSTHLASSSASAAALLATSPKPTKPTKPTPSEIPPKSSNSAGARAAQLAAGSVENRPSRAASTKSNAGSSAAATMAFKSRPSPRHSVHATPTATPTGGSSLAAAQGALHSSRPRSASSPSMKRPVPAQSAATTSALSAATLAHKPSMSSRQAVEEGGAVPTTTLPRSMFTSHPPIGPEADDQKKADEIHNSAVAMAKTIYMRQQRATDSTKDGHGEGQGAQQRPPASLQDAAYKLAQERLSKLEDEHSKNRSFQEYYGSGRDPMRRLSMRQKLRRRASSDTAVEDRKQSENIRKQMSLFSNRLSQLDDKKRQEDRSAVLAAAQRNVKARLEDMDQSITAKSGMVQPSKASEWELKAHAAAQSKHESRNVNKGKRDVGGGKFVAHDEIDAIASKRMQPVLDDINKKAEEERQRLEAIKAEEEAKKVEAEKQKAQEREIKENHRKLKEQQKAVEREQRHKEKEEERARKEEEKARKKEEKAVKAEEKKSEKEEERRSREIVAAKKETLRRESNASTVSSEGGEDHDPRTPPHDRSTASISTHSEAGTDHAHNEDPKSPRGKVRSWLKTKLARRKSSAASNEDSKEKRRTFLGGISLKGRAATESTTSLNSQSASMREVAMAGKDGKIDAQQTGAERSTVQGNGVHGNGVQGNGLKNASVSSLGSEDDVFEEASESMVVTPPAPIQDPMAPKSSVSSRDSRFREIME